MQDEAEVTGDAPAAGKKQPQMEAAPLSPHSKASSQGKKSARIAPQSSRGGGFGVDRSSFGGLSGTMGGGSPNSARYGSPNSRPRPVSARSPNSSRRPGRDDYFSSSPPAPYQRPQIQPSAYAQLPPRKPNSNVDPRKKWPAWSGAAVPTGGGGATGSDSSSTGTARGRSVRTPRSAALAGQLSSRAGAANGGVAECFPGLEGREPTPSTMMTASAKECVEYLRQHGESNSAVSEAALGKIGSHCHSAPLPIGMTPPDEEVCNAGGVTAIVKAMAAFPGVDRIQAFACSLIGLLCDREERVLEAANSGGVRAVIDAMTAHQAVADILTSGCLALGQVTSNTESAREAAKLGGISIVVRALRSSLGKATLQANGCMALANLVIGEGKASDAARCEQAVKAGAFPSIVAAFKKYASHDGVLHWGTTAILRLTHESPERAQQAIAAGAKDALYAVAAQPMTHGEALAAKVELAHRWLAMHESLAAKGGVGREMTKAERIFNDMLWEQATCDGDLPEATIFELTTPPPNVVAAWS